MPRNAAAGLRASRAVHSPQQGLQARHSPRLNHSTESAHTDSSWITRGSPRPEAVEVLQLKEEQVQLRESNVLLEEKGLQKKRELEDLDRAYQAKAAEYRKLTRQSSALKELNERKQEEMHVQEEKMKEKLHTCRSAVARAVGSIDEIYGHQDTSMSSLSGVRSSPGSIGSNTGDVYHAKAAAEGAGAEVDAILNTWNEGGDITKMKENTDALTILPKKLVEEAGVPDRSPLSALSNVGF